MDDLALIILNYNSAEDTVACVRQLLSFNSNFRIIIVDNHSTDDSYRIIQAAFSEQFYVDILQAPENGGYSAGNNLGMKYAEKDIHVKIIGILNPDIIIPNLEVLTKMKAALISHKRYAIIGGCAINAYHEYNPCFSSWDIPTPVEIVINHCLLNRRMQQGRNFKMLGDKLAQVECVAGCFFLAKLAIMRELGYLDENVFLYNEENILGIKCKKKGYIELIALDQFYIHNHKHDLKRKPWKKMIYGQKKGYDSRRYLCKSYYSVRLLPLLWIVEIMNRMYLFVFYFKNKIKSKNSI